MAEAVVDPKQPRPADPACPGSRGLRGPDSRMGHGQILEPFGQISIHRPGRGRVEVAQHGADAAAAAIEVIAEKSGLNAAARKLSEPGAPRRRGDVDVYDLERTGESATKSAPARRPHPPRRAAPRAPLPVPRRPLPAPMAPQSVARLLHLRRASAGFYSRLPATRSRAGPSRPCLS